MNLEQINILGYSGSYLALIFETLSANNFKGNVNIIRNEEFQRAPAPFDTGISFNEVFYADMSPIPTNGFVFCSNKPFTKKFLFDFFSGNWNISENNFVSLLHPSAVIASSVEISNALYIEPLSAISAYAQIGFGVTINRNCSIGHHNVLGDFCAINPGVNLCGNVVLKNNVTIGAGTTVFPNVVVGENSIIGGGSIVTKNIPDNVLAYGNPCKIIKEIQA